MSQKAEENLSDFDRSYQYDATPQQDPAVLALINEINSHYDDLPGVKKARSSPEMNPPSASAKTPCVRTASQMGRERPRPIPQEVSTSQLPVQMSEEMRELQKQAEKDSGNAAPEEGAPVEDAPAQSPRGFVTEQSIAEYKRWGGEVPPDPDAESYRMKGVDMRVRNWMDDHGELTSLIDVIFGALETPIGFMGAYTIIGADHHLVDEFSRNHKCGVDIKNVLELPEESPEAVGDCLRSAVELYTNAYVKRGQFFPAYNKHFYQNVSVLKRSPDECNDLIKEWEAHAQQLVEMGTLVHRPYVGDLYFKPANLHEKLQELCIKLGAKKIAHERRLSKSYEYDWRVGAAQLQLEDSAAARAREDEEKKREIESAIAHEATMNTLEKQEAKADANKARRDREAANAGVAGKLKRFEKRQDDRAKATGKKSERADELALRTRDDEEKHRQTELEKETFGEETLLE